MTTWISDADHRAVATVLARLHNEGKLVALTEAIVRSPPCPFTGVHTNSGIKIAMGEAVDVWPMGIVPDLIKSAI